MQCLWKRLSTSFHSGSFGSASVSPPARTLDSWKWRWNCHQRFVKRVGKWLNTFIMVVVELLELLAAEWLWNPTNSYFIANFWKKRCCSQGESSWKKSLLWSGHNKRRSELNSFAVQNWFEDQSQLMNSMVELEFSILFVGLGISLRGLIWGSSSKYSSAKTCNA